MTSLVCTTSKTAVDNIIYYPLLSSYHISQEQSIVVEDQSWIKKEDMYLKRKAMKLEQFVLRLKL